MATVTDTQVGALGTEATKSSAPAYTPLVGSAPDTFSTNTPGAEKNDLVNTYQRQTDDSNKYLTEKGLDYTYKPQTIGPGETLNSPGYQAPITDRVANQATNSDVAAPNLTPAAHYDATQVAGAKGTVDPNSLVENQYSKLLNTDLDANGNPKWAAPAVTASNQRMNALGLGSSTMAANASTTAVLNAALPIAEADAQVYAKLNSQNLSNSQDAMLSDAAWDNAAKQFNAKSDTQTQQFYDSLTADIAKQNADRDAATSKYNAGAGDSMQKFTDDFNNGRDQFNIKNQLLVDQSNAGWRRTLNTANTAGENAATQANTKDAFNLTSTAQNNLWQQARDEASWSLTSDENVKSRDLSLVNSALNRSTSKDLLDSTLSANTFSSLGSFATNLVGGSTGTSLINSITGSGSDTSSGSGSIGTGETSPGVDNGGSGANFGGG